MWLSITLPAGDRLCGRARSRRRSRQHPRDFRSRFFADFTSEEETNDEASHIPLALKSELIENKPDRRKYKSQ
jgi:hypothetical protein